MERGEYKEYKKLWDELAVYTTARVRVCSLYMYCYYYVLKCVFVTLAQSVVLNVLRENCWLMVLRWSHTSFSFIFYYYSFIFFFILLQILFSFIYIFPFVSLSFTFWILPTRFIYLSLHPLYSYWCKTTSSWTLLPRITAQISMINFYLVIVCSLFTMLHILHSHWQTEPQ